MSSNELEKKLSNTSQKKEDTTVQLRDVTSIDADSDSARPEQGHEEDVFKIDPEGKGPDLRGVTLFGAVCLIVKSLFGLGVLGLPLTLHTLGFVPGLISLTIISAISTATGLMIGQFRLAHPQVHSIGDAAHLLFGRIGAEIIGGAFWLFYTFCFGSALLTVSIAFNTFTDGNYCTLIWIGVGAAIALVLGIFTRTLKVLSWLSYVALTTILIGVWIAAIGCLARDTPAAAPIGEPINKNIRAFASGTLAAALAAVAAQSFSMAATASFFTIHAEMRNQRDWNKAVLIAQTIVIVNYFAISCIIYGKVGQYIASPALGSAGPVIQKVAYGVAFPALLFTTFFQAHVACKYVMVRVLRGTRHLQSNSITHWAVWSGNITIVVIIGLVIACAIPFFSDLISLTGALLGTTFQMIFPGLMYIYEARPEEAPTAKGRWILASLKARRPTWRSAIGVWTAVLVILIGLFICIGGTYGTIKSISDGYASGAIGSAFSCADNSNSK
ncbi:unnamed protein product [Sympodiomycopsis kandeliae]